MKVVPRSRESGLITMLAKRATTKSCLSGGAATNSTFTPFLYQTRTILRSFTAGRKASKDALSELEAENASKKSNTRSPKRRSPPKRPRAPRDESERPRPIPFEGKMPSGNLGARVEGSTMTPKELRIFEELFKAKQVQPDSEGGKRPKDRRGTSRGYKPRPRQYEAGMPEPVREFPDILRPLAEEAAAMRARASIDDGTKMNEESRTSPALQNEKAVRELESIKSQMNAAETDLALWEILQNRVFENIRNLPRSSKQTRSGHDFQVLTQTLPQSLLHFMQTIRNTYPGSPLGLVLLPTLKKLGPSAFALGASTELFNEHMRLLYDHYADLDGIAETLSEMDKNVYEFDAGTKELVSTILRDGHRSVKNVYGPGMQALWSTDRKTRGLEKIRRWDGIVEERLQAAALRAAQEQQNEYSEDDEEDQKSAVA